jgi:hypothetical protein
MKRGLWILLALAAACSNGGDICTRAPELENSFINKASPCVDGGFQFPIVTPPTAQCETQLAKCSSDDKSKLNSFADCIDGLPTCTPGQELAFGGQFLICLNDLANLSSACTGFGDAGR